MKKKFSKYWKASKKPRKQRKYLANAPISIKRKKLSANLNKELKKKYQRRNFPVKLGDGVKILRGKFKKKIGKINQVKSDKGKVFIDGVQISKKDGTKVNVPIDVSNIQIQELNLEDKKRIISLERKLKGKQTLEKK